MNYILITPIAISFLITLLILPNWIKRAKMIGLVWDDMNKFVKKKVSGSGGLIAVLGFVAGVLIFVAYRTFLLHSELYLIGILALLTSVLFLTGVGLIDDLLGWRKGGLKISYRIILVAFASIPLVAINAGRSTVGIPFVGSVELGLIYPLILIPIGIVGATTTFNFLAGFNGLESGQGILILTALAIVSYFTGSTWLVIVALTMVAALLAFLIYNFTPARVFPGDCLTYAVGGLIAIMAILGNFEKIAVFFFIPYILEVVLKSRGKLEKQSFGKPKKDGSLDLKYDKIYSLNHLAIYLMKKWNIKPTEKKVVIFIWTFQIVVIALGFLIYGGGIF